MAIGLVPTRSTPQGVGGYRCLNGLRASSRSPFDSSQNADNVAQNMNLRPILSFKRTLQHCLFDAHSCRAKHTLSCTPVRVHL
eukprot:2811917-Heterocapsa_arctica.AAC.1